MQHLRLFADTALMSNGFFDAQTAAATPEPQRPSGAPAATAAHSETLDAPLRAVREATLELMRAGVVEAARKPSAYRALNLAVPAVTAILLPLGLRMRIDELRGLAWLAVDAAVIGAADGAEDEDAWSHPLVRRQRLNLEQSLLVAILRQQFVAHEMEAGVGAAEAQVALDDLLPHLQAYLGELGSDAQEKKRLLGLLEQLKVHALVSEVDEHERVSIRPLIAHLANPENLHNLLQSLRAAAGEGTPESEPEPQDDEA